MYLVLTVLPHTFLICCSLSEHGPGGIDGLASWPQLCGPPLMVPFGPPDDPHGPPVTPCQCTLLCLVTKVTLCQYGGQSVSIQSSSGWRRKEYRGGIVVLALERSSAQWWVLTLGFMGLPGDRGDNPPLRSRPSLAQCLCPLCALTHNSYVLPTPPC